MLNCKQVTELASKNLDTSTPWSQRLAMQLHLLICKNCARYVKHIKFIQKALSNIDKQAKSVNLTDAAKKRIQQKLDQSKIR